MGMSNCRCCLETEICLAIETSARVFKRASFSSSFSSAFWGLEIITGRGELELGVVDIDGEVELKFVGPEISGRRGRGIWFCWVRFGDEVPVLVV